MIDIKEASELFKMLHRFRYIPLFRQDCFAVFPAGIKRTLLAVFVIFLIPVACTSNEKPPDVATNTSPHATIDYIDPAETVAGSPVLFKGHGTDPDDAIVSYVWLSDLDGLLSDEMEFTTSSLSVGEHIIHLKVQDDNGAWSEEVTGTVAVLKVPVDVPVVEFFLASPDRIGLDSYTTLGWYVSGVERVNIDNSVGDVAHTGKVRVMPSLSTRYKLSAENEAGKTESVVDVVVVPKSQTGLPVIDSFAAAPGDITAGDEAELRWDVRNADVVTIEPDIGAVEPAGTVKIQPDNTTSYVISAGNDVGLVLSTTQVLVTTAQVSGQPDLFMSAMDRVVTTDGVKINYTIMNRGTADAPECTVRLYANGLPQADDRPGVIAAGDVVTRVVDGWMYNPATRVVDIVADADHNVVEDDEDNNEIQIAFPVHISYDFMDNAPGAQWGSGYPYEPLEFGGSVSDENGFALFRTDKKLEDGTGPGTYLETHPRWTAGGWIIGDYTADLLVEPGDHFYCTVGLLHGAAAGSVRFWVYIRENGKLEWEMLVPGIPDGYDYKLETVSMAISPEYFGKNVDFSLRVDTVANPLQDWAVWVKARIVR